MKIHSFPMGMLETNVYFLEDEKTKTCLIIDPAMDAKPVIEKLKELCLTPLLIILTHGHFDHAMAIDGLCSYYNIDFYIHPEDNFWLSERKIETAPRPLRENDTFCCGEVLLTVMHTPGHSCGSVCLFTKGVLFSGDTLFKGTVGRTDFAGGSLPILLHSLTRLKTLDRVTRVYPGHGDFTTIGNELDENPYMKNSG